MIANVCSPKSTKTDCEIAVAYQKPKHRLHRDFVYLNHDTILNSLSALEAGKVDEIIQKTSEATDRGLEAGVSAGPVKAGAGKKKQANMEYELVRRRTLFSGFDAWHSQLTDRDALGRFDTWDLEVRNELEVGDTIEFRGQVSLSPLYLMFASYQSFVSRINKPGSVFKMSGPELKDAKETAEMMKGWTSKPDGTRAIAAYFSPNEVGHPKLVGTLLENYLISGLENIQGEFHIVAQVDSVLKPGQRLSVVRVLTDVPPTPKEVEIAEEALKNFQGEVADELGVRLTDDDLAFSHPDVILRPLAIFK